MTNDNAIYRAAFDALLEHGSERKAAKALGIPKSTLHRRVAAARAKGRTGGLGYDPVVPGFEITQISNVAPDGSWIKQRPEAGEVYTVPEGYKIKGESVLSTPDGRVMLKWTKTREGEFDPLALTDMLKARYANWAPSAPAAKATQTYTNHVTLYTFADPHFGMFSWGKETNVDWDLNIAGSVMRKAFGEVVDGSPPTEEAILLIGGDTLHADNNDNTTAKSHNSLQVDGRYGKVLLTACECIVDIIEMMRQKHKRVTVRVLQGNHDEHSSFAIAYFMLAWYRNASDVDVDVSPSKFWFCKFGKNLLGATHGDFMRPNEGPMFMANERPQDWGDSVYRAWHFFHTHRDTMNTIGGVHVFEHEIIAPKDGWHKAKGFMSGRSLKSITYAPSGGESGRKIVCITPGYGDEFDLEEAA